MAAPFPSHWGGFSPSALFAHGEQGCWYDPTDLSSMWQDAVTPVTAVEQPVGFLFDKSKNRTLGSQLISNGGPSFSSTTGWSQRGGSTGSASVVSGKLRVNTGATAFGGVTTSITTVVGAVYYVSATNTLVSGTGISRIYKSDNNGQTSNVVYLGAASPYSAYFVATATTTYIILSSSVANTVYDWDFVSVQAVAGNHATQSTDASRPVLSARVNLLLSTATLSTQSVTTLATDYTLYFEGTGTITLSGTKTGTYSSGSNSLTSVTAGTLTLTVSGTVTNADLRPTNIGVNLPVYQRVNTSTDYDTAGFPLYLKFDGVDDSLATSAIDFTGTSKMSVFAGQRKQSDATQGVIAELSATIASNNGTWLLTAPNSAAANYNFSSKGTTQVDNTVTTYTAPLSGVLTGLGDISAPSNIIRVNGAQAGSSTSSQGTGNYGNFALFVGRRNSASLQWNGNLYGLIIRGASTSTPQIAATENWLRLRGRVY